MIQDVAKDYGALCNVAWISRHFYGFEADVEWGEGGNRKASTFKAPIKRFILPTVSGFGTRSKLSNVT